MCISKPDQGYTRSSGQQTRHFSCHCGPCWRAPHRATQLPAGQTVQEQMFYVPPKVISCIMCAPLVGADGYDKRRHIGRCCDRLAADRPRVWGHRTRKVQHTVKGAVHSLTDAGGTAPLRSVSSMHHRCLTCTASQRTRKSMV